MITLMLIVVLFFGVRIAFAFNYATSTISCNVIIFNRWYIFRYTSKVIDDNFFYYVNNGAPKKTKINKKKKYVKMRIPRIKLYDVHIHLSISAEDIIKLNMVGGLYLMFCDYLRNNSKIIIDNLNEKLDVINDYFDVKCAVGFIIKYGLLKILFAYLHMIILNSYYRRKYGIQSNRRTHAMHSR